MNHKTKTTTLSSSLIIIANTLEETTDPEGIFSPALHEAAYRLLELENELLTIKLRPPPDTFIPFPTANTTTCTAVPPNSLPDKTDE